MPLFDAINHAMTTISTGGYSTHDASFGYFNSVSIHWIAIVFMALGSMPFLVHVRFFSSLNIRVFGDYQILGLVSIISGISLFTTMYLYFTYGYDLSESLTLAFFNITSIISTTGYASTDYIAWGPAAIVLFFFITFIGGCSGSTSGGMKIFRFQLSYILLKEQITKTIHPRAVLPRYYGERTIDNEIIISAVAFTYLFLMTFALIALLLAMQGLDFMTSISGAATALANVGPGLGEIIGPAGNFQTLSDATKWILSAGMLLGRLELLTIVAVFSLQFWNT
jgi:trk system potassium uptake protein TrkH